MLEPTRMVNVQVTEDNSSHFSDIITGRFDRSRKFVLLVVLGTREYVGAFWTALLNMPSVAIFLGSSETTYSIKLFCTPRFKQNATKSSILNQGCKTYEVSQLVLGIWIASSGSVGTSEHPAIYELGCLGCKLCYSPSLITLHMS